MPMDPYSICPCGSGKKLKFCCLAISNDMEKVEKLIDNHQPRMALQILDKLAKSQDLNPWVVTRRAASLLSDDRAADAKNALLAFLRQKPDHPSANALYAMAMLQADGLPEARKAIQRAFRFSIAAEPIIVAGLAQYLAEYHWQLEQFMAARQHMVMALQLGNENQRQEFLQMLMEFDSDSSVPFSFRGGQSIPPYQAPEGGAEKVSRARRLASVGCWGDAAVLLTEVAEQQDPTNANLWRLIGLFRGWSGDEAAAAVALHKSAELDTADFDQAVETETLAQELDRNVPDHCTKLRSFVFDTDHVSKLLSVLDEAPRLVKVPSQPPQADEEQPVAAIYAVLDRPAQSVSPGTDLSMLSRIIGRVTAFDSNPQKALPPRILATALEGSKLEDTRAALLEAAGDLVKPSENTPAEGMVVGVERPDDEPMTFDYYMPKSIPAGERRRIRREFLDRCWGEGWKSHPLRAFGGKTPQEVGTDPAMRVKMAAAIDCLEAVADDMSSLAPIDNLRREFAIPAPTPIPVESDAQLKSLSLSQLRRVDAQTLTESQFRTVVQRASLARLGRLMHALLTTWIESRDSIFKDQDERLSVLGTLNDLASRALQDEEADKWNAQAQAIVSTRPDAFEKIIEWKLRELQLRLSEPSRAQALYRELWDVYGAKIPRLRLILEKLEDELGLEPSGPGIVTATSDTGGLWSPDDPSSASASVTQKLWLPEND